MARQTITNFGTALDSQMTTALQITDNVVKLVTMVNEYAAALDTLAPSGTTLRFEAISAAGALTPGVARTDLSVDATKAYTLADGSVTGFVKTVRCMAATNTPAGTLTITTPEAGTSATYLFDNVGQMIELMWTGAAWRLVGLQRAGKKTYTVGTNNILASHLYYQLDLSVTGTVASTLADGLISGDRIHFTVSTAAGTPHGSVTGNFAKETGVASGTWGSGTDITATTAWLVSRWDKAIGKWVTEGHDATVTFA